MIGDDLLSRFVDQFDNLKIVVSESSRRSIADPPDILFYDNQNVFVKAYLVSACSMLEAFIQDLAMEYVEVIQSKINSANLPFNLVAWIAEHDKAKLQFKPFEAKKTRKEISDLISPNYWKTIKAFERIGVDISASEAPSYKDIISTTVEKRNRIVHENDSALDLSFSDVSSIIDVFREYCKCLFECVRSDSHVA